jgi:hypothetical protein
MKIARALFVGGYRIGHTCLSLQFDHYLQNIDHTYIFTNVDPQMLDTVLKQHNIDTSNFTYVEDAEMDAKYPTLRKWWFDDDYRGSWLYQQALKLASIDYIDADVTLIQDPDTFSIVPYSCINEQGQLKFFILPNETHSYGYYKVLENSLGMQRQTPHCFVTEFMPSFKEDWIKLKSTLETRNNCDAFDAMINNVPVEPDGLRWFSEYEYLGNWAMTQRPVELIEQKRFQYKSLDELDNATSDYNCICDAIPKLEDSIMFDWNNKQVIDFDVWFNKVKKFL